MAIDNNSLCYLFDPIFQVENIRGIPIVGGHIEVFIAGTDQKYITWQNFDGARNPFKIPLNNDGRATILVEPNYTYDAYIYDSFNNMVCSRLNIRPVVGGDIVVSGITQVWHDESLSGDGTLQSPLTVVSAGKVYSGVEPIVVNNDVNRISANHVPLGLQEPLYFVEDSESACIIGCSAKSEIPSALSGKWEEASNVVIENSAQWEIPEGTMNESAFSYDASSNITAYNGSAFKAGDEFPESATEAINVVTANSAKWNGPYVPLDPGNTAKYYSFTQGEGNSAHDHSMSQGGNNSARNSSLAQGTNNSALNFSIAQGTNNTASNGSQAFGQCTIATATGMAIGQFNLTQSAAFVIGNGTYTARSDLFVIDHSGNVSSQGDISASGVSLTSFYTNYKTNSANFITALPADLVYTGDIQDMATTGDLADKLDTSSFSSVSGDYLVGSNVSGFVITATGDGFYNGMTVYISQDQAFAGMYLSESDVNGSKQIYIDPEKIYFYSAGEFIITAEAINAGDIATLKSLSSSKQDNLTFSYTTANEISAINSSAIAVGGPYQPSGNYIPYTATEDSLTAFKTNSGLWVQLTAVGDGSKSTYIGGNVQVGYVGPHSTNRWAILSNNQLKFEIDSNGAYDSAYVDREKIHKLDSASDYIQNNSAIINEVNTSYQTNSSNFLTAVDLTPYQTTAGMTAYMTTGDSANFYTTANESGFITAVPDTYLQNTDLSTEDGKVTAISGIPLSAGGDVPEGVMVESGLEYNAVNEISAYNGSAIAQYGAEKQWLQHDDTIVHVSNSAQYAFGCNISALQRLMGIDETVLFDATSTHGVSGNVSLSESRDNFDHIRIIYRQNDGHNECKEVYNVDQNDNLTLNSFTLFDNFPINKISTYTISGNQITFIDGGEYTTQGWSTKKRIYILQVIGIGRKS